MIGPVGSSDLSLSSTSTQSRSEVEVETLPVTTEPTSSPFLQASSRPATPWVRLGDFLPRRFSVLAPGVAVGDGVAPGVAVGVRRCCGSWVFSGVFAGSAVRVGAGVASCVGSGVGATTVSTGDGKGVGCVSTVGSGVAGGGVGAVSVAAGVGSAGTDSSCANAPAPSVAAYRPAHTRPMVASREIMRGSGGARRCQAAPGTAGKVGTPWMSAPSRADLSRETGVRTPSAVDFTHPNPQVESG